MRLIKLFTEKVNAGIAVFYLLVLVIQSCSPGVRLSTGNPVIRDSSLLGNFTDDYKIKYTITGNNFTQHPGVKYNLIYYNEKEQYFIAQNDSANVTEGGLFTRIDITRFTNMEPWRWGFCLTAYKASSKEEAEKTAAADRLNPKKGCNGYPFSRMKRVID